MLITLLPGLLKDPITSAIEMRECALTEYERLEAEIIESKHDYGDIKRTLKYYEGQTGEINFNLEIYCYRNLLKNANDRTIKLKNNFAKAKRQLELSEELIRQLNPDYEMSFNGT